MICRTCGIEKSRADYYPHRTECKKCKCNYQIHRHNENKLAINRDRREQYQHDPEKYLIRNRAYRAEHPEKYIDQDKHYRDRYPGIRAKQAKNYRGKYPGRHRAASLKWQKENPLPCRLRTRLWAALKLSGSRKVGSHIEALGCSIEQLRAHLEKQFQPGMSWDNYGRWHIDHIIPLSAFNLSDPNQLSTACHFSNLQPLWKKDNAIKWAKIQVNP
jgi:hypothetical protein